MNFKGDFMKISDSVKNFIANSDATVYIHSIENGFFFTKAEGYEDLHVILLDNYKIEFYITDDVGYKPILKCRDFLTDELNFELETEYGLTDMTQKYIYKDTRFQLKYLNDHDMIVLDIFAEEKIPKWLLETARCLVKLCKETDGK